MLPARFDDEVLLMGMCETNAYRLGELSVRVDRYGDDGPAFFLLHGIPGGRTTFRSVAARLATGARVFVPDLPGFGDSDRPSRPLHAAGYAELLQELLGQLPVDRVHLAGFDFGGPVAVLLHREAPSRVASLALLATNVFPDTPIPLPLRVARVPLLGALAFRVLLGRSGQSMMWLPAVVQRRSYPWSAHRAILRSAATVLSTREIFLASLRDLDGLYRPVQEHLAQLRLPVAVLWGDRDPFFPVSVGERTAAAIAAARWVLLPGTGHFLPEERPAEVAEALAMQARSAATGEPQWPPAAG